MAAAPGGGSDGREVTMFGWLRRRNPDRALKRRIAAMPSAERLAILAASPLEAGAFQGQGWLVFRKGVADFNEAFVTALGEIDGKAAEDWLIERYLRDEEARRT